MAWIKVVMCLGLVNLLGLLKMRNKNTIFLLCGYGHSVRMAGFPVLLLLPASQWHFIVMVFCKYSHFGLSIFPKVRGSWQTSKWGNAVHTFIHSAGHSLNLTPYFSQVAHGAEKERSSRAQRWLWDISDPCVELPWGCSVSEQNWEQMLEPRLGLASPAASGHTTDGTGGFPGSSIYWLRRKNRLEQGRVVPAAMWPSHLIHPFLSKKVHESMKYKPRSQAQMTFWKQETKYWSVTWIVPAADPHNTEENN